MARITDFMAMPVGKKEKLQGADELEEPLNTFLDRFREAMDDDFNTALAIGHIYGLIHETNKFLDHRPSGEKARTLLEKALGVLKETGAVLRVFERTPEEWYSALMEVKDIGLTEDDILSMIQKRQEAREEKDWARADGIRDELEQKGILLEDKPGGSAWRVKVGSSVTS
jgi:cysteinyl-tRNA synthetase